MNIAVCINQVFDPEVPASRFQVDAASKTVVHPTRQEVINPFDENAIEAALQIKEKVGGKVTAICLGSSAAIRALRSALGMGVDDAVLLEDSLFEGIDSRATAYALARAVQKIGNIDLILCGRQTADWGTGMVPLGIAEILGLPAATTARKIETRDGRVRIERMVEDGYQVMELPLPSVVAVSNEINSPRLPGLMGVRAAFKRPIQTWKAQDIGAEHSKFEPSNVRSKLVSLRLPAYAVDCKFCPGESLEEAAIKLAELLKEEKLI